MGDDNGTSRVHDHKSTLSIRRSETQGGAANVPELGDVALKEDYVWLHAIGAYHHIVKGTKYPAVMGITGVNDPACLLGRWPSS